MRRCAGTAIDGRKPMMPVQLSAHETSAAVLSDPGVDAEQAVICSSLSRFIDRLPRGCQADKDDDPASAREDSNANKRRK